MSDYPAFRVEGFGLDIYLKLLKVKHRNGIVHSDKNWPGKLNTLFQNGITYSKGDWGVKKQNENEWRKQKEKQKENEGGKQNEKQKENEGRKQKAKQNEKQK